MSAIFALPENSSWPQYRIAGRWRVDRFLAIDRGLLVDGRGRLVFVCLGVGSGQWLVLLDLILRTAGEVGRRQHQIPGWRGSSSHGWPRQREALSASCYSAVTYIWANGPRT